MSALEAVETYYRLFGARGVVLALKARALNKAVEIAVSVRGIQHPVHLRLRTSDVSVFRQVLVTREYESPFRLSPRVIIDAGANIGLTSVFYANQYPESSIVAIEPEASNFQMLRKNTAPYKNVRAIHAALWKDNREIDLMDPNSGHYGFRTLEQQKTELASGDNESVQGMTLDRIMADLKIGHVDILKLDIEGSEKEVFETSAGWIDEVETIVVELHDQFRVGCARSLYLAAKDFGLEWRNGETIFLARKHPPQKSDETC
jgi:FkbM family methyltransferase